MRFWKALSLAALLMSGLPAVACPNCKEAVASAGDSDDDPTREARAYNWSIYFMLAVPYSLLATGSFIGYRMYRAANRPAPATEQS